MDNFVETEKTLYVSDLDGTLLGSDSRLSGTAVELLNIALGRGVLFSVATARTPATVVPLLAGVRTTLPYIVLNGAALWDPVCGDYADVAVMPDPAVQAICDIYESHGLRPFIYRRHGRMIHASHSGPMSAQEEKFVAERQGLELKKFFLDDGNYRNSHDPVMLIFAMRDYAALEPIYAAISRTVSCSPVLYHDIFDPRSGILECYAAGVSKAEALQRLALAAGARRTVAFGDNRNDLPLLRAATVGVAVANAFDEVRHAAAEVTGPNTADSVPRYILRHMAAGGKKQ